MKRIFVLSIMIIIGFAFMAYGVSSSGAWFTDQATIENNSITTGNIDLVISDVVLSNTAFEPGADYQEMVRFCVRNAGNYNMKWRGKLTAVQAPAGMADQILMRAVINPADDYKGNYGAANTEWFTDQPATALMAANPYILLDSTTNQELFKPADVICYSLQAKLPESADNAFQQKTFAATLQLDATQWISTDSGWTN